jgi:hypothetical protein
MSFKYPLNVFLDILETRFETLPFLLTNTSQIITAKNGVVAINKMIPAALMKAPYLSASPPEPQCCSCAFFFFFFFVVVVVVDGFFIPLFFRLFGVGDGDFLDDFFPAPVLLRLDERAARADVPAAAIVRCCCGGGSDDGGGGKK